ncbi:hypothetical protein [Lysinibacillus sp. RS5]|uniref:hypothetical protein n=1 Tax=unclassified Lysinibacillus TaxID=2636778 RepID=UPI0035BE4FC5
MSGEMKNSAMMSLEIQMMMDNLIKWSPLLMKHYVTTAKLRKSKYDSLIAEGFTEQQAIEIITKTPITE